MRTLLYLHLLTMAFWFGGQLFLFTVALPALRSSDPTTRAQVFREVGRWFGMISIPALAILLGTGVAMMNKLNLNPGDITALQRKLELVGLALIFTFVHVIASANGKRRLARVGSIVTLVATLGIIWYATGF
jgi:uncharacterized membrane protein